MLERSRSAGFSPQTILASSMAFIDGTVRERGVACVANESQCHRHRCAMGSRIVRAFSLCVAAGRRLVRRSLRSSSHLFARCCDLRVASAACGLAGDIHQLIVARAFQGFAQHFLSRAAWRSSAILSPSKNADAQLDYGRASAQSLPGVGPVLGGWLIEHVSCARCFSSISDRTRRDIDLAPPRRRKHGSRKQSCRLVWRNFGALRFGRAGLRIDRIGPSRF